jgi:pimeloyl-ACP methyl ester carboxylesterase
MPRTIAAASLAATVSVFALTPPAAAGTSCEALADLRLNDVNMLSAVMREATDDLPEHCSVRGYVRPAINFEIRLPAEWNGGFYMAGCGGMCGQLLADAPGFVNAMNYGLRRGYAAATMDGGHWGLNSADARFAFHDRIAEVDWAERAVRETARVAKAVIEAHYGDAAEPSIFAGCSTGGRQGYMAALKDPELFDGIIAGAPALDYTGLVATFMTHLVQANHDADGEQIVTSDLIPLIRETALAQCDGLDGVEDGVIADPDACIVDWSEAACGEGTNAPCLTEAQVGTLTTWFEEKPTNSAGEVLYDDTLPVGSEAFWPLWLTGLDGGGGRFNAGISLSFLQNMAFRDDPGEGFTSFDFDFDAHPPMLDFMGAILNTDVPDLTAFQEAGGRMITWHGLADAVVPHGVTLGHFEALQETHGQGLDDFNRLFLIPGMDHCGVQPGPGITQAGFDPLTALEDWLETGEAPERLETARLDADGEAEWSRPVCAWPAREAVEDADDWRAAEAWACE